MKKILSIASFVIASQLAVAAPAESKVVESSVAGKESRNSAEQICVAAMTSKEAAKAKAIALKVGRSELRKIRCNEYSVMEFAKIHAENPENWSIATVQ